MKLTILIVDDESSARYGMKRVFEKDGYNLIEAEDGITALDKIKSQQPDLVFLDINMPDMDGISVLKQIKNLDRVPLVIMITAYGSEKIAVEAMKAGAYDYITKPYEIDELRLITRNALEKIALERENIRLRSEIQKAEGFGDIIGKSKKMQDVYSLIEKVSPAKVTVLIQGESGTGKELVAREIHRLSERVDKPFVTMNCAALPENLTESELFGHEKGAFTGAHQRRKGKFELANNGTLFLDEIGDMSLNTQSKVLRVLQEETFERLGGTESIKVDVRLLSATNKDLLDECKKNNFREDLYYRLKVVDISLPPLRDRKEDIPLLVKYFLEMFSKKYSKNLQEISSDALRVLMEYNWPGNVRELKNAIERSVVLTEKEMLEIHHLPNEIKISSGKNIFSNNKSLYNLTFKEAKKKAVEEFEKEYIEKKLAE